MSFMVNGTALKNAIRGKGLTLESAASSLGVTRQTLHNWTKWAEVPDDILQNVKSKLGIDLLTQNVNSTPKKNFQEERLAKKNETKTFMVPLVPVKAQAGYVRAIDQAKFIDTMEEYAMPPGVNPIGAVWRYWEVEGESMEPVFHNHDIILTSQVHPMDWENIRNFYLYVIVTDEKVLFKRLFAKNPLEWVLISENEDQYPQQLLPVEYVKEVWVFRRHIVKSAPPHKEFEIKV